MLIAIGGSHWYQAHSAHPAAAVGSKPSVAVLPLQNLSTDPDSAYFSDGMTDEITTKLSKIQGINVAPHSSVTTVKAADQNAAELGRELGVRYLLEGTVRKSGNQVRVNVHLIDSTTGFQVWADDFTGEMKDVFSLQEQTALKIAQALNLHLSTQETKAIQQRYTQNPQAYEAFLVGRGLLLDETPEKMEAARKSFEQALKFDPNYAPALAGLSHVEGLYYRDLDSNPSHLARAEEFARRAIATDPELGEAHIALAQTLALRFDYSRAVAEFREATRLEPDNPFAWDLLSWALGYEQPPDATEAEKAAQEAIRLQPTSAAAQYHLGRALIFQTATRKPPPLSSARKSWEAATTKTSEWLSSHSLKPTTMKPSNTCQGDRYKKTTIDQYWLAAIYSAKGDKDKSLAALQQALQTGYRDFAALDSSPYFANLRSDPRYQKLIAQYRKQ